MLPAGGFVSYHVDEIRLSGLVAKALLFTLLFTLVSTGTAGVGLGLLASAVLSYSCCSLSCLAMPAQSRGRSERWRHHIYPSPGFKCVGASGHWVYCLHWFRGIGRLLSCMPPSDGMAHISCMLVCRALDIMYSSMGRRPSHKMHITYVKTTNVDV